MDTYLETYNLPKMNQEETDNLNTQIDNSEIEFVILKKSQQTKVQDITQQFCQTYKEELMPVLLKLFKKLGGERTLPNSFYETTNTQTPKLKTLQKKKKNYMQISLINTDAKILNKILVNKIQ